MAGPSLADESAGAPPSDPGLATYLAGLTFLTILVMMGLVLQRGEEGPATGTSRTLFLDSPKSCYLVCGHEGVTDEDGEALEALQARFESSNICGRTRVESLFAETISRKALLSGVRRLAESGEPRGLLLWVYAGPVRMRADGELSISTPDEPVPLAEVVSALEASPASRIVLLIDGRQVDIHEMDADSSKVAAANGLGRSRRQHLICHVSASSRGILRRFLSGLDGAADGPVSGDGWVTLEEMARYLEAAFDQDPDPLSVLVRHHGSYSDFYLAMRPPGDPEAAAAGPDTGEEPALRLRGMLRIETDPPGADLFLALTGESLGSSPLEVELPIGWHQILARGSPGFEEARQEIEVVRGASTTMRLFLSPVQGKPRRKQSRRGRPAGIKDRG